MAGFETEWLYKLLLIAVTLPITSASCERPFTKVKVGAYFSEIQCPTKD